MRSFRYYTRLFFTGFTMGASDLVPGVSGGTIAFIFGIYDELLESIKTITGRVLKLLLLGDFRKAISITPFHFLIPLALGLGTAIFGFVKIIAFLLSTQAVFVWSFFFGLVIGSIFLISRRINKWTPGILVTLFCGFVFSYIIVGLPSLGGNTSLIAVFLTGVIAITAMILPGISGSLIMVILGQYQVIIEAVARHDLLILITFSIGAITGLSLFVRFLLWLLKKYYAGVVSFLVGIMIGSLREIWPWKNFGADGIISNTIPELNISILWAASFFILGLVIIIVLEKFGIVKNKEVLE